MTIEKLAKQIFDECEKDGEPVTMEEATEMAEMELGAKSVKTNAESEKPRKAREPKERKIDEDKKYLIDFLAESLDEIDIVTTKENEVKLHFNYNKADYTLTLTKHRKKA